MFFCRFGCPSSPPKNEKTKQTKVAEREIQGMNGGGGDINSLIYLPARLCHPPRVGALLGLCQLSSPPAETYNSRLATLIPKLSLSARIKTQLAKGYGNCWLRESFLFIYFSGIMCVGAFLGKKKKKSNQGERSLRGIS